MTLKTHNTYILGMKNVTEHITGNEDLWSRRGELHTVKIPGPLRMEVTKTIHKWLADNVDSANYIGYEVFAEMYGIFVEESDAVHFKLRWLHGNKNLHGEGTSSGK